MNTGKKEWIVPQATEIEVNSGIPPDNEATSGTAGS